MMKISKPGSGPNPHRALLLFLLVIACLPLHAQTASLALTGLRTVANQGQFNAIQSDAAGNLYLLLDQHDGIRLLKTDPTDTTILAQAHLGAQGDIALSLALDPAGNPYITGTTTSGTLSATAGAVFPTPTGTSTNSFIAKLDPNLNLLFLTFAGSDKLAASSIAANANAVYITGSIFSPTLLVTPSAILQSPSTGSTQNGFVEKFNTTGTTLLYATYLTGASGNTAPSALTVDPSGNAYITGYTSASGYPTLAALVPNIIPATSNATSGFLTKLTPAGDGIIFSTFIPGSGLTSIALDAASQTLLLTGSVSLGQFPIATATTPLIPTTYQTLLRLPLDGSTVLASTLLAPGTQSIVTPAPNGTAWIAGTLTLPLLPTPSLSTIGNTFAAHVTAANTIDQTARFGGLPTSKPTFASALANLTSLTTDATGQPTLAGSITPQASASLLATETFDVPLYSTPTSALPNTLRNAVPTPASCAGSLCPGSAAYLIRLTNTASPSLALSYDAAPNLTLRNLGSVSANALTLNSTTFALTTNCPQTLAPAAECSIALTGTPPGTLILQAANAATQTITIPTFNATQSPIVFSPKELDFGIQTASCAPTARTITITNLTLQPQTFTSKLDTSSTTLPYTLAESASDCTISGLTTTKLLAPGGTCHITLALTASATPANDTLLNAQWLIGTSDVLLTGYTQAAALSLSASEIDFGTQYTSGLRLPRFLYLSNPSDTTASHALINSPATSPFAIQDNCPTQLTPRTICQLQLDYIPTQTPSNDSITLNLDQGLSALVTGQSLPQPGINGASANPNLTVSSTSITFPNPVVVTSASSSTQTITIGNTGASPFALALSLTGDFTDSTNCTATLAANATCSVVITFAPSQPGTRQGILSVTAGATSTPAYVNLIGTGTPILPANNGTLNLGDVIVGQPAIQWFKVSQSFSAFTATIPTSDFTAILVEDIGYGHGQPPTTAFTANPTGTCINCWLGIQFKPSTTGPRTATITLSSSSSGIPYTLNITGTGLPLLGLILTPVTQDFGTVPVHSTSAPTLFTLTNLTSNATPITVTAPAITGDFALSTTTTGGSPCTGTLAANASCFGQITFAPTTTGPRTGTLTLTTSAGPASAPLTGYGSPDPGLALNPTALIFNNVPASTASTQTITLTNTGTTPLQIATPTVTISNFIPTTNCNTLAPAATCTITIAFTPSNALATDTLQIPVTIAGNTTNYTVPLTGAYTTEDIGLQIIPAQADFGPNPTATLGLTRQFTINNLTAKSLALSIALPRQFVLSGPPCAGLAPNASCSFSATFLPLTNGDITGTLFAQANPTDGSATLNALGYVEGYGTGSSTLSISGGPLSPGNILNFGQVASGQTASRTLTLTNKAAPPLTIRRITTQWPFLTTSTCGQTLALNQSCTVTVTYTPLNQRPTGTSSPPTTNDAGFLTIESDAVSSPDLIDLPGTAAPALVPSPSNTAPLLSYTASQNSLTFATTSVGNLSIPQTVTLSNTGTATLHILSLQTSPDFTATRACATLIPGASCDLTLYFSPQATGTRIGALEILSDSSSSLDFISLIGAATPSFLTLNPAALDFGTLLLGNTGTLPLQITNTASNAVTFNSVSATGDYTASNGSCPAPGATLPIASSCTLQISFTPTQTGSRTGTLSLNTSASNIPLVAALTGIGAQSHLQIAPATLNFGNIAVGSPAILSFTLTNTGNAPVTGITLATPPGDYAITVPCNLTTLAPGAACPVTVTFTPTAIGPRTATLTITSSATTSPDLVPLTGTGIVNGTFTFTVNSASASTTSVTSGRPATYNLTLTPINNFAGTVVLNCTPIAPADYATCSILPSSIPLNGAPQNAVATIQTVTSINLSKNTPTPSDSKLGGIILCLLTPTLFLFHRKHRTRLTTLWSTLLTAAALATLLSTSGCGKGGDSTLRYSTPGTYHYQITASSTSGIQITQSVTVNLTVNPR